MNPNDEPQYKTKKQMDAQAKELLNESKGLIPDYFQNIKKGPDKNRITLVPSSAGKRRSRRSSKKRKASKKSRKSRRRKSSKKGRK